MRPGFLKPLNKQIPKPFFPCLNAFNLLKDPFINIFM